MSAPTLRLRDGLWVCSGAARCPGGAVWAKGTGETREDARRREAIMAPAYQEPSDRHATRRRHQPMAGRRGERTMSRLLDTDYVSRVSTGKAASEGYRRERRARSRRLIGYTLLIAAVIGAGVLLNRAKATPDTPATVDAPPGPVCPDWGTRYHSCL